ncbi:hypothetical protein N7451_012520 [Penicillium sp. IBT 35674x]|nr:hypothetical protein N7451_012520 [Penicillium sp. IBT 35674x]
MERSKPPKTQRGLKVSFLNGIIYKTGCSEIKKVLLTGISGSPRKHSAEKPHHFLGNLNITQQFYRRKQDFKRKDSPMSFYSYYYEAESWATSPECTG